MSGVTIRKSHLCILMVYSYYNKFNFLSFGFKTHKVSTNSIISINTRIVNIHDWVLIV